MPDYVIVPEEYEQDALSLLAEIGDIDTNVTYHQIDLLRGVPDLPGYAEALEELDLWHEANIWSNAPVAVHTSGIDTRGLVSQILPVGGDAWRSFVACEAEDRANEDGLDAEDVIAEMARPVPDDFKETMRALREHFRLDRLI